MFLILKILPILELCWRLFDNWWLSDERDLARIRECAKMARERNRKGGKERRITDPGLEQRASVSRSWQLSFRGRQCPWQQKDATSGLVVPRLLAWFGRKAFFTSFGGHARDIRHSAANRRIRGFSVAIESNKRRWATVEQYRWCCYREQNRNRNSNDICSKNDNDNDHVNENNNDKDVVELGKYWWIVTNFTFYSPGIGIEIGYGACAGVDGCVDVGIGIGIGIITIFEQTGIKLCSFVATLRSRFKLLVHVFPHRNRRQVRHSCD